jgi:CheY-like chemotaxis protein
VAKEILIAVSEKPDQEEFKEILGGTEYRLIFADNGEDALQQIRFFKPTLVIAETALSEMSGLQICKAIKADRELNDISCVLLKGSLEDLSKKDVGQVQADGVISKPLRGGEVLKLVERLRDKGTMGKKEESLLEDLENLEDNEVIELVDVVEEPEPRLSIDDFLAPEKEEMATKMAPLESWDKQIGKEEKPLEEELNLALEGLKKGEARVEAKTEVKVQPKAEAGPVEPPPKAAGQEAPKDDLFEKIALEDIFLKVEKLKPDIERELAGEGGKPSEAGLSLEEGLPLGEETAEKPFSLEEFETVLKRSVSAVPEEEILHPVVKGEPRERVLEKEVAKGDVLKEEVPGIPPVVPVSEEKAALAAIEKDLEALLGEEKEAEVPVEFSVREFELKEEKLGAEELGKALQPFMARGAKEEGVQEGRAPEVDLEEEELKDFLEEEFPKAEFEEELKEEEFPKEFLDQMVKEEGIRPAEEPQPERVELFEGEEAPDLFKEEMAAAGALGEEGKNLLKEMEEKLFEDEIAAGMGSKPERAMEMGEMEAPVLPDEEEVIALGKPEEERKDLPEEAGALPRPSFEETRPIARPPDKQVEEILTRGVQAMMEDFVRKVVPEMTQNLLNVTMERIESMVKEVVPDIAEKAIKDEIRKLQEGDKE